MASILKVDDLRGNTTANDITVTVGASATQSLHDGLVKHFANFDGRGNTFYGSFNASSVTDNATGDYTITVTTAFNDTANMAFTGLAQDQQSSNKHQPQTGFTRHGGAPNTTTTARYSTNFDGQGSTLADMDGIQNIGVGDLA